MSDTNIADFIEFIKDSDFNQANELFTLVKNDPNLFKQIFDREKISEDLCLKIFNYLHDRNYDFDMFDEDGQSPLHFSCKKWYIEIIKFLIDIQVNLEVKDKQGKKPIDYIWCAFDNFYTIPEKFQQEFTDMVNLFIDSGIRLDHVDINGMGIGHYICATHHYQMINRLIDLGVDFELADNNNLRPIHYACMKTKSFDDECSNLSPIISTFQILSSNKIDLECMDSKGNRPIHYACQFGSLELIKMLVDQGVNLECVNAKDYTPIFFSIRNKSTDIMKYLIDCDVNLNLVDFTGNSILHKVCYKCKIKFFRILVESNIDLEIRNGNNETSLHLVCNQNSNLVSYLSTKFNITKEDILKISHEMCRTLVDHGVDVNCKGINTITPIQYACYRSNFECFKYLIDNGADFRSKSTFEIKMFTNPSMRFEIIPIHIACSLFNIPMIQYMIEKGVDLECMDNDKNRPIHCVCGSGYISVPDIDIDKFEEKNWPVLKYWSKMALI